MSVYPQPMADVEAGTRQDQDRRGTIPGRICHSPTTRANHHRKLPSHDE